MGARLRGFFDIRSGEALPVFLTFLYIAVVVAAFLLAKPIRNALFLRQYGPYALVYVYAAVPLALSVFVPIYTRVAARFGHRVDAALFRGERAAVLVAVSQTPVQPAAWRLLCLGQLFRDYRARSGLELCELAVRHAAGQAVVRPHRRGRVAGRDPRRIARARARPSGWRRDQFASRSRDVDSHGCGRRVD